MVDLVAILSAITKRSPSCGRATDRQRPARAGTRILTRTRLISVTFASSSALSAAAAGAGSAAGGLESVASAMGSECARTRQLSSLPDLFAPSHAARAPGWQAGLDWSCGPLPGTRDMRARPAPSFWPWCRGARHSFLRLRRHCGRAPLYTGKTVMLRRRSVVALLAVVDAVVRLHTRLGAAVVGGVQRRRRGE